VSKARDLKSTRSCVYRTGFPQVCFVLLSAAPEVFRPRPLVRCRLTRLKLTAHVNNCPHGLITRHVLIGIVAGLVDTSRKFQRGRRSSFILFVPASVFRGACLDEEHSRTNRQNAICDTLIEFQLSVEGSRHA
jgi:hypothetical protein